LMSYFSEENLKKVQPVLTILAEIAKKRGKTIGQVAINWTLHQDIVYPLVGVKRREQVEQAAGSLGWQLTEHEMGVLRSVAESVKIDYFSCDS